MIWLVEWLQSWTMGGKLAIIFFPFVCIALLFASLKLVAWGEVLIAKTKMGGGFVGGFLIATITSFPEMITEIAQGLAGTPENGIGDDLGSNAFSIFLIGVGAIFFYRYLFLNKLNKWTKISLVISSTLMTVMGILLFVNKDVRLFGAWIGVIPMIYFLIYIVTIYLAHRFGEDDEEPVDQEWVQKQTKQKGIIMFTIAALTLMTIAFFMNVVVSAFAAPTALDIPSESAGGIFLAITTSLPEIVAFFIFMKKQQPGAAIASLTGSHFFNLGISFFGDIAYSDGPTFDRIEMSHHAPLAFMGAIMCLMLVLQSFFGSGIDKNDAKHAKAKVTIINWDILDQIKYELSSYFVASETIGSPDVPTENVRMLFEQYMEKAKEANIELKTKYEEFEEGFVAYHTEIVRTRSKIVSAFRKKRFYMIIPTITSLMYIIGWVLILTGVFK